MVFLWQCGDVCVKSLGDITTSCRVTDNSLSLFILRAMRGMWVLELRCRSAANVLSHRNKKLRGYKFVISIRING